MPASRPAPSPGNSPFATGPRELLPPTGRNTELLLCNYGRPSLFNYSKFRPSARNISLREEQISQRESSRRCRPEHKHFFNRQFTAHHKVERNEVSKGRYPRETVGRRPQTSNNVKQERRERQQTSHCARYGAPANGAERHGDTA